MTRRSLRLRLALAASALIALALALAGFGLLVIFDRILDERTAEELDRTAKYIAGQMSVAPDGRPSLAAEPADPRFATPYDGLYWQITGPEGRDLRSRSLWDTKFESYPLAVAPAAPLGFDLAGPAGQKLLAVSRRVSIDVAGKDVALQVVVAIDRNDLAGSRAEYLRLLVPSLVALGLVLALAMWIFVARALGPLRALREEVRAVEDGRQATLSDRFPDEVQPLVEGLNRMIVIREAAIAKAQVQAGDMAHGLKTPLAVLGSVARRLEAEKPDAARAIEEQILAMGWQVERSLARARAASLRRLGRRSCRVEPVAEKIVAVLGRLPEAASLRWEVGLPEDLAFPAEEGDLTELLGNLLDNARKWAHRRIRLVGAHDSGRSYLAVEDDGPGMSAEAMARISRGRRWDENVAGTGFGLAIVSDLAEETGATLTLGRAAMGGLRAELSWETSSFGGSPRREPGTHER